MKVGLKYTLVQNRTRYEKFAGHMPPKRRETREPFYDNNLKLFKWCMLLGCDVTSKRKSNIKGHMNNCDTQKKELQLKHVPTAKLHLLKNTIEIDILRRYTKMIL